MWHVIMWLKIKSEIICYICLQFYPAFYVNVTPMLKAFNFFVLRPVLCTLGYPWSFYPNLCFFILFEKKMLAKKIRRKKYKIDPPYCIKVNFGLHFLFSVIYLSITAVSPSTNPVGNQTSFPLASNASGLAVC